MAGLSPLGALKAVTSVHVEVLGRDDVSVLAPRKLADIVANAPKVLHIRRRWRGCRELRHCEIYGISMIYKQRGGDV